jgi:hypothetical protein
VYPLHVARQLGVACGKADKGIPFHSQEKRAYLDVISRYVDIHATVGTTQQKHAVDASVVPGYVTNHGILNSAALHQLLQV